MPSQPASDSTGPVPFTFRSKRFVKMKVAYQAIPLVPIKCDACNRQFVPRPGGTAIWCEVCRGAGHKSGKA